MQLWKSSEYSRILNMQGSECAWIWLSNALLFVTLEHLYKHFVKNTRKKGPAGKLLQIFLLDILKTAFWMGHLTQRWTQSGPFFPKSRHFERRPPLISLVAHLWVWLNMHQYHWIYLNILEIAWINGFDYDHLTYLTGFWRCLEF